MYRFSHNTPDDHDVFVTGVGMVTPLAWGREATWKRLVAGECAGRSLTDRDVPDFERLTGLLGMAPCGAPVETAEAVAYAAERVAEWNPLLQEEFQRHFGHDLLNNMVAYSLADAMADAGLNHVSCQQVVPGCVIGTSKPSLRAIEDFVGDMVGGADRQVATDAGQPDAGDLWQNAVMPDGPLRTVRFLTQASGPTECPVAACATGLISVLQAAALIRSGRCDVCIAGSADAALRPAVIGSFHRLGVLSRGPDAASACKPFDRKRDGFTIGEGAGLVVLESRRHAQNRGATAYGQVVSGGWMTDPTGMTQIDDRGSIVAEVLKRLAQISGHPDHIQLHGTATSSNDLAEANGLGQAFGSRVPVGTGVKGAIGHLLGAAGSVEFGLSMLSLRDQLVPGMTNLTTPDPDCSIPLITGESVAQPMGSVLKLSLGFGGHVAGCGVRKSEL